MITKKRLLYVVIILGMVIFQKSFVPLFFSGSYLPDAVLMLVLTWTIIDGFEEFLWWAVFAGFLCDLFFYTQIGMHIIIFVFTVYFVSFFSRRFLVEISTNGIFLIFFFIIVVTFFSIIISFFALSLNSESWYEIAKYFSNPKDIFFELLFNGFFSLGLFFIIKKVRKFLSTQ